MCNHLVPPLGLKAILGHDLKHCVQCKTPQTNASDILDRLERNVRIRFRHNNSLDDLDSSDNDEKYDPKIYSKNGNRTLVPSSKSKKNFQLQKAVQKSGQKQQTHATVQSLMKSSLHCFAKPNNLSLYPLIKTLAPP
jgi:hypothetical protein